MDKGIRLTKLWFDIDIVELRVEVADGSSVFANEVYVAHDTLDETVSDLDRFRDHVHGGLYNLRFGEFGVGPDGPRDEYACLVGPLLTMLQSGATQGEIASYLEMELVGHFGLELNRDSIAAAASRVRAWFDRGWKDPR